MKRAQEVLRWLREDGNSPARGLNDQPRPILIEFAGTPKSGKSTCIEAVRHFFHRTGFKVATPSEGASRRTPSHFKSDLTAYNAWNASYAIRQVIEIVHQPERFDIGILDRGLFDTVAWFEWLAKTGEVDRATADVVVEFIMLENWRASIDIVVLMQADPADAMQRENENKLVEKTGRAMNPESLAELNVVYDSVQDQHKHLFPFFLGLDTSTTEASLENSARLVVEVMLGLMEAQMP
ncbi:hypothetical protein [Nocardioides sp. XL1]|uniref:hypothetical protein n=1 Tax=Nocardioides sp. XL1 TaxID=2003120 RepID=UPI0011227C5E|nr:hypothetical protein [Nocardioides sp. XL1]